MSDKRWSIFCKSYSGDKITGCEIAEGVNDYGDGPERIVCKVYTEEDAKEICRLHNESIKENA